MLPEVDRAALWLAVRDLREKPRLRELVSLIYRHRAPGLVIESWTAWRARTVLDRIDSQSMKLLPLALQALERAGYRDPEHKRIAGMARFLFVRSEQTREHARRAADALARRGVMPVAMKGLALATDRYRVPLSERPMLDADLVVPPEAYEASKAWLSESGFRVVGEEPKAARLRPVDANGETQPFDIDLHRQPLAIDPKFSLGVGEDVGEPYRVPAPAAMVLTTILHGLRQDGGGFLEYDLLAIRLADKLIEVVTNYGNTRALTLAVKLGGFWETLGPRPTVVEALELRHVTRADRVGAEAARVLLALRSSIDGHIRHDDIERASSRVRWDNRWLTEWRER